MKLRITLAATVALVALAALVGVPAARAGEDKFNLATVEDCGNVTCSLYVGRNQTKLLLANSGGNPWTAAFGGCKYTVLHPKAVSVCMGVVMPPLTVGKYKDVLRQAASSNACFQIKYEKKPPGLPPIRPSDVAKSAPPVVVDLKSSNGSHCRG